VLESRTRIVKWIYRLSILQAAITFCMILLGGVVHNTGSSLACPDWPTCFGSFFPEMTGGILIEHSHRILGTLIGITCILQLFMALRFRRSHRYFYLLVLAELVAVVFQGVLGGITVKFRLPPIVSTLHLALSQLFFLGLLGQAFWSAILLKPLIPIKEKLPSRLFLFVTLVLIYLQIFYGAAVRHFGYSAACGLGPDFSLLCMDAETGNSVFWPSVSGSQFHMLHRILGVLVALSVIASTIPWMKWSRQNGKKGVRILASLTHLAVFSQIAFGIWTLYTRVETVPVTLHLAGAVVLLGSFFFLYLYLSALNVSAKESRT
jgi:heme A synthase